MNWVCEVIAHAVMLRDLIVVHVSFSRCRMGTHGSQVGISMMQIIASANSVYDIPWPQSFSGLLDVLKVFLVDFITITRTNCAARLNYYQSLLLTLLLFKVSSVAGVLFPTSGGMLTLFTRMVYL